jgi:hypothetical protein
MIEPAIARLTTSIATGTAPTGSGHVAIADGRSRRASVAEQGERKVRAVQDHAER